MTCSSVRITVALTAVYPDLIGNQYDAVCQALTHLKVQQ
jgi:hypothetical protein